MKETPERSTLWLSSNFVRAHATPWLSLFFALLLYLSAQQAWAQDHSMHHGHDGHDGMPMVMDEPAPIDALQQSKLLADKKESEFNHHLAGIFVILAGLFILAQGHSAPRVGGTA